MSVARPSMLAIIMPLVQSRACGSVFSDVAAAWIGRPYYILRFVNRDVYLFVVFPSLAPAQPQTIPPSPKMALRYYGTHRHAFFPVSAIMTATYTCVERVFAWLPSLTQRDSYSHITMR